MKMTAEQCAAQARAELDIAVEAEDAGHHLARAGVWARLAQAAATREAAELWAQALRDARKPSS